MKLISGLSSFFNFFFFLNIKRFLNKRENGKCGPNYIIVH